jgi:hypothetical protein
MHRRQDRVKTTTHPWIDASEAPLYVIHYPAARSDDEVVAAHAAIRAIYESSDRRVGWVVDASDVRDAPATQRKIVAEHEARVRLLAERRCAGLAVVLPNAIVRGFFTAVTWISPLAYPHRIFQNRQAASAWVREQLAARSASEAG